MDAEGRTEQEPGLDRPSAVRIKGITMEEYDKLPEAEKRKYEERIPDEQLEEWNRLDEAFEERRRQLFVPIMDIPPADWIVEGIAAKEGVTLFFGDSGLGKTSLMLQLIGCLHEGKQFLGLKTGEAETLLIEQDEAPPILRTHVEKMLPLHPTLRFLEVPRVSIQWNNDRKNFADGGQPLDELIGFSFADIVIIDSLTSLGIEDINHPSSSLVFDRVRDMARKWHCAFIVLHHPNKSGDVMGSNLIPAKLDCMLQLDRVDGSVQLLFRKLRASPPDIATAGNPPFLRLRQTKELAFNVAMGIEDAVRVKMREGKQKAQVANEIADDWQAGLIDTNATTADNVKNMARRAYDKLASDSKP